MGVDVSDKKTYEWYYGDGRAFTVGQKVWYLGKKARVEEIVSKLPQGWMVPIAIKGNTYLTIAHIQDLKPRGKK